MAAWIEFSKAALSHKPAILYLAYGSNLSIERMKERCPDSQIAGMTYLNGYRLLFKKSRTGFYATIEQDANCKVPAAVYLLSEWDEMLLDRYEGCPKYYYKRYFELPVFKTNGRWMKGLKHCMAYVLHEDRVPGKPSKEYYELLQEGYRSWGFEKEYLMKGLSDSIGIRQAETFLQELRKGE